MSIIILCFMLQYHTGEWSNPVISGQCPPAGSSFTLTKISNNKAILFGGSYNYKNDEFRCISNIYSAEMTKDAVVSKCNMHLCTTCMYHYYNSIGKSMLNLVIPRYLGPRAERIMLPLLSVLHYWATSIPMVP